MKFNFQVAVRRLVEYVHRSGDLDYRFSGIRGSVESIRVHQRIQKKRSGPYEAEVSVSHQFDHGDCSIQVSGRMDGIFRYDGLTIVEEIKTVSQDIEHYLDHEHPVHWGQVKAYAFIWADEKKLDTIGTQLVYCQLDTKRLGTFYQRFSYDELKRYYTRLIDVYIHWATFNARWKSERDLSIKKLSFPFDAFRKGQRALSVAVYRALRDEKELMIQGATGIGKTMGVLFPSLKSIGSGHMDRFIYLTARTTGRIAAENTLNHLHQNGLKFRYLSLTAKDKICFCPEKSCASNECEYAKGHYDRLNEAIEAVFTEEAITRKIVVSYAKRFRVCPFEFSLEIALWVDGIICDYNYVFDPRVSLKTLFENELKTKISFLIDESHNLIDRAREMYSASIEKEEYLELRRMVKGKIPALYKALGKINSQYLKERKKRKGQPESSDCFLPLKMIECLKHFIYPAEKWLAKNIHADFTEHLLTLYHKTSFFLKVAERFDDAYICLYTAKEKNVIIKLFCIDPSGQLKETLTHKRAAVFFSATLTPFAYFKSVLGISDKCRTICVPSPFPPQNFMVLIAGHISTYYRDRNNTKEALTQLISLFVERKKGNTLVFFPSYEYMNSIYQSYVAANGAANTVIQKASMSEEERIQFLNCFKKRNHQAIIGFSVMGGVFNEGVDLSGNQLSAVIVVGVGLPMICLERDIIKEYYNNKNQMGFEYAYQYPGLNKVFQSAGRVIRSEQDKGVLLLIDKRYGYDKYRRCFPAHWAPVHLPSKDFLEKKLNYFLDE